MDMPEQKTDEAPKKRVFAPSPSLERTGLFEKKGPAVTICIHAKLGFHIGTYNGSIIWSHQEKLPTAIKVTHPDMLRIVSTWPNDKAAMNDIMKTASMREYAEISFATLNCDVAAAAEGPYAFIDGPISHVSIESCAKALACFSPKPEHKLDPSTRKLNRGLKTPYNPAAKKTEIKTTPLLVVPQFEKD